MVRGIKQLSEPEQREVSRLAVAAGQRLLQHGAESTLVMDVTTRLGLALGVESVEVSLSASSMVLTTLHDGRCITTTRRCQDRGINMQVVTEIQRVCIMAERGVIDVDGVHQRLEQIKPLRYNRVLVIVMIGLSCASFSRLAGGDWPVFLLTFVASSVGMFVRQEIAHAHFNPLLNFGVTAFVTTLISGMGQVYQIGETPFLAMASSVLMLVPGFPLINAVSDMVKGFSNMGIARWTIASLLTLSTSAGIVAAMNVLGVWGWLS
ncbi:threonine/serine exporter family protein [Photobacterium sp.]|uniref:threonine/serine ThrE exporter family protein n=1 Tax=Photobacterium sp. TaxID=660 RepID=UPI00299EDC6B|nr:threonine/serine exporter family protein [Photobacterium sp.]MDX1303477.1 threonine/serine exporter family protein [Photobacterium sp.]